MQGSLSQVDWLAVAGAAGGIAAFLSSIGTLLVVSFNGGKLTKEVEIHEQRWQDQFVMNGQLQQKLGDHTAEIARLDTENRAEQRYNDLWRSSHNPT